MGLLDQVVGGLMGGKGGSPMRNALMGLLSGQPGAGGSAAGQGGVGGARAGLRTGDQIVAPDGRVFPDARAFAAYLGSKPTGGGPARRVFVALDPATDAAP